MKIRITIILVLFLATMIARAGTPHYLGQVRVFLMQQGKYTKAEIDEILALPPVPVGKYLYVHESYLRAAVVTIGEDGRGVADILYNETEGKR